MLVKFLVLLCSSTTIVLSQYQPQPVQQLPAQYPAGIDPKSCPNYPECSNPLVGVQTVKSAQQYAQPQPQAQYQPQAYAAQPQYQPQYTAQPQYQQQPLAYQARYQQPAPQYQQAAQPAQQEQSQYSPDVQQKLDRGEYIGDGDYHGEGLAESLAPEYAGPQQQSAAPVQQAAAPQYYQPQPAPVAYAPQPQQYSLQYAPSNAQSIQTPAFVAASQYAQARSYSPSQNALSIRSLPSQSAQIPAGLDPNACPNYPFCH